MDEVREIRDINQDFPIKGDTVFGVKRLSIELGDCFHSDNLAVSHAINKAFGETERDNHSECHHRQAMQSVGDCHKLDPVRSQNAMDKVMEGSEHVIKILSSMKENQIRWLQNGRNSKKLIHMVDCKTVNEQPCLVAWGIELANTSRNQIQRRIGEEVGVWFSMPVIIVSYHFEDELSRYFEVTMKFNSSPGELSPNPGFWMLEIQIFFHQFVQPWWNLALTKPEKQFPKTFKYIADHVQEDKRVLKRNQVLAGIKAGYDEMIKMHEQSITCPIIFLILVDSERAPNLLRAMLILIQEQDSVLKWKVVIQLNRYGFMP